MSAAFTAECVWNCRTSNRLDSANWKITPTDAMLEVGACRKMGAEAGGIGVNDDSFTGH